MTYELFSRKNELAKAVAGLVLAVLVIASVYIQLPASFAHAAALAPLTVSAVSDDTSGDTTLNVGDSLIVSLDYRTTFDILELDPSGACTINGKDVKASFQDFGDGTYQLVYTVAAGDTNAAAGQIPFTCALKDTGGNSGIQNGFTVANNLAINTSTTGIDNGGLPNPGTFESTVDPSTGTVNVGGTVTVSINDKGGITDFAVDPAGSCTINGKDVKSSFQSFGDHHYQLVYTVAEGDADVTAGQLAINCAVKNPAGTTGTINTLLTNTLAIDGTTDTGGNNNSGNTGTVSNATVQAIPSSGTLTPGQTLEIRIHQNNNMTDLTLNGSCTINSVSLTSMENLGGGDYKLLYTVGDSDSNVASGQLQLSCNVKNGSGQTALLAFTDGNTVAINVPTNNGGNNNGGNNNGGDTDSTTGGTIDGDVEGGPTNDNVGTLAVLSVNQVRSVAQADGVMENGWKWIFRVTVPNNEPALQMKFGNWSHSNGVNSISPAQNMRISSLQAQNAGPVTISASETYTATPIIINNDLDPNMPGRQVDVVVEMAVPVGSMNGTYGTTYGIKTSQN